MLIWNRETGAKREIADDEDRPFSVRWSPDGRKLALTTARGERGSARGVVRVVDASSGQVVAETDPALDVSLVRWQDQGLLLSKGPSALLGGSGRKDFRWQGGNDTPVELAASPTFTPRGGRVTVSVTDGVLWVAPKAGAAAKRFAGRTRADSDAILDLADGRLDFVGSRWLVLRSDETYVLDLETLKLRPLCLRKGVSFRESSPDGSRLLFVADDARHGFVGKAPPCSSVVANPIPSSSGRVADVLEQKHDAGLSASKSVAQNLRPAAHAAEYSSEHSANKSTLAAGYFRRAEFGAVV